MYNEEELARPYARALAQAAVTMQLSKRVRGDIEALELQWENSSELRDWCAKNHSWPRAKHGEMVQALWGETFSKPVLVMLEALSAHGLLATIPQVIRVFRRFIDVAEGQTKVQFVFAISPTPETEALLRKKAIATYGKDVQIEMTVDASWGAGLIIRAGYTQIDGSLVGRLRRLKQTFATK
jgi:ATP synthase F1 delta subunit